MSEQFAFEQILRYCRAIDDQKRGVAPGAQEMNKLCRQLLAGSGFSGNKYRPFTSPTLASPEKGRLSWPGFPLRF